MKNGSEENTMLFYSMVIRNAINSVEIAKILSENGYPPEKMQVGIKLLEEAKLGIEIQKNDYASQYEATQTFNKLEEQGYKMYMKLVKIARTLFEENPVIKSRLLLDGERKQGVAGWLSQAEGLYRSLLEVNTTDPLFDLNQTQELERFGYNKQKLVEEYEKIKNIELAKLSQKQKIGIAQEATKKKDAKIELLDKWVSKYVKIVRILFADRKDVLEQLGITVKDKSSKTNQNKNKKKKKNSPETHPDEGANQGIESLEW